MPQFLCCDYVSVYTCALATAYSVWASKLNKPRSHMIISKRIFYFFCHFFSFPPFIIFHTFLYFRAIIYRLRNSIKKSKCGLMCYIIYLPYIMNWYISRFRCICVLIGTKKSKRMILWISTTPRCNDNHRRQSNRTLHTLDVAS